MYTQDDSDPVGDRGKLKVAIKFCRDENKLGAKFKKGSLFVSIKGATGLPRMDPNALTDASVKLYLLPSRSALSKKKTKTINDSLDPTWDEVFEFRRVSLEDLTSKRVLELTVWDYDRRGCKDFIGCLRLGSNPLSCSPRKSWMDSSGEEVAQWEKMLSHSGEWVEWEHSLRPSIQELAVSGDAGTTQISQKKPEGPTEGQEGPTEGPTSASPIQDLPSTDETDAAAPSSRQNSIPRLSTSLPASFDSVGSDNDDDDDDDDVRYA
jgi:hypothetical protein